MEKEKKQKAVLNNLEVVLEQQFIKDSLTEREIDVLKMRFGVNQEKKTLEQAGKPYNLSRERIRQVEAKALKKLRHPERQDKIIKFLINTMGIDLINLALINWATDIIKKENNNLNDKITVNLDI